MLNKSTPLSARFFNLILLAIAFAVTAFCVISGQNLRDGYDISVGDVSPSRFVAPREIENSVATQENRRAAEKAADDIKPILKKDTSVNDRVHLLTSNFFLSLKDLRSRYQKEVETATEAYIQEQNRLAQAANQAVGETTGTDGAANEAQNASVNAQSDAVTDTTSNPGATQGTTQTGQPPATTPPTPAMTDYIYSYPPVMAIVDEMADLQVTLSEDQRNILLHMDDDEIETLEGYIYLAMEKTLDQGVSEIDAKTIQYIKDEFSQYGLPTVVQNIAYQIATSFISPNYLVDDEATQKARSDRAEQYETVLLKKGQMIIDKDQIVMAEQYAMLFELGYISDAFEIKLIPTLITMGVILILFTLVGIYINIFNHSITIHKKESTMLFTMYITAVVLIRVLMSAPYQLLPIFVFVMLIATLIDIRLATLLNICLTVIAAMICAGNIDFFLYFSIGGIASAMLAKYTIERNKVLIVALLTCVLNFALMFAISYYMQRTFDTVILYDAGFAAASGLLSVVLCLGSLPFWEMFFGVVTTVKLLELTDPANPVMRRLTIEAPGTYHHSLIVANLSETAAYDIGCDHNLARVGGYYHDIGKLVEPGFFAENLVGSNPHDFLDSKASISIIINHVYNGLKLADEYRLPPVIRDMIAQHHGTTLIKYFYYKDKNADPAANINEDDYRYPFIKPHSKEAGIIMLADTVEAAVRASINSVKSFTEIERLIRTLIKDKLDDGQLIDSMFVIKDLETIASSFMNVFRGMYHERIKYPEMKHHDDTDNDEQQETKDEAK